MSEKVSVSDVANRIRQAGLASQPVEQLHGEKFAVRVCDQLGIPSSASNVARVLMFMKENDLDFEVAEYPKWIGHGETAVIAHNEDEERAYLEKLEGDEDAQNEAVRIAREQEGERRGGGVNPPIPTGDLNKSKGAALQYDGEANPPRDAKGGSKANTDAEPALADGAVGEDGEVRAKRAHYGVVTEGEVIKSGGPMGELAESKTLGNPDGGRQKPPPYEPGAADVIEPGGLKGPEASPVSDNRVNDDVTPAERFDKST